jgi:hypothetical protein
MENCPPFSCRCAPKDANEVKVEGLCALAFSFQHVWPHRPDWPGVEVSHPFDREKSKEWGTEHLRGISAAFIGDVTRQRKS